MAMTKDQLLNYHKEMSDKGYGIMVKKNHDYAGASGTTPFANFEACERLSIAPTEHGMLIRMLDKMQRISTYINSGELLVENEGVHDACVDIMNYSILLSAYIKQKKNNDNNQPTT